MHTHWYISIIWYILFYNIYGTHIYGEGGGWGEIMIYILICLLSTSASSVKKNFSYIFLCFLPSSLDPQAISLAYCFFFVLFSHKCKHTFLLGFFLQHLLWYKLFKQHNLNTQYFSSRDFLWSLARLFGRDLLLLDENIVNRTELFGNFEWILRK